MRDSVVFYRSFYEAIRMLPAEQFKASALAILEYGLDGKEPDTDGIERTVFCMAKPQIDANNRRYENGTKGGRPKTKPNQTETKDNLDKTKTEPKEKEKVKENVNDKDNNNISSRTSPDRPVYPYKDVIDYLNLKAGTAFRSTSKDTQKHIRARIDEGYTLEDFKRVIDVKVSQWGKDPAPGEKDMRGYLRPNTLFGTKFEGYLQEKTVSSRGTSVRDNNNFERRKYDMDALERQLLREQIGGVRIGESND